MKFVLQLLAALALIAVSACVVVLSIDAHQTAQDFDQTIVTAQESLKVQSLNLASDEQKLDAVLDVVNSAATEQRNYWQKTSADSDKTVKALRIAVDRASLLLRSHRQKSQRRTAAGCRSRIHLHRSIRTNGIRLRGRDCGRGHISNQRSRSNDGQPGQDSARLANAAAYFQSASGHADKILADGEKTADYYEKKLTTPASFAQRLGYGLLDVGSKLGNIMAGFVK